MPRVLPHISRACHRQRPKRTGSSPPGSSPNRTWQVIPAARICVPHRHNEGACRISRARSHELHVAGGRRRHERLSHILGLEHSRVSLGQMRRHDDEGRRHWMRRFSWLRVGPHLGSLHRDGIGMLVVITWKPFLHGEFRSNACAGSVQVYTITDRGPNQDCGDLTDLRTPKPAQDGGKAFPLEKFAPSMTMLELDAGKSPSLHRQPTCR
jgi:hypothetical protein